MSNKTKLSELFLNRALTFCKSLEDDPHDGPLSEQDWRQGLPANELRWG